ncbi:ABC transporter ATP-binding protein [Amycolatopsis sp. NPDC049253]|uniref:ABC transporter ATP-binding protein n=1 Tax=Amycolatopsis sp. NPDC049253 TaxID=3155274 RepID=UPI0034312F5D
MTLAAVGKDFPDRSGTPGGGLVALDGVDLTVRPGEFIAVVGPSGCGKTTLLRLIAGMTGPTRGSIVVGAGEVRDARTGFVFQHASLYPWRTVLQNVAFGLELRAREPRRSRRTRGAVRARARELVELVGLAGFESYFPHQISGGMQQRANLARALAIAPELLLMDEPFSALDAQTREELQIELQRIAVEANTTTVFVTHDIGEALYLADRVVVLTGRPGRIKEVLECPTARPRSLAYQVSEEFLGLRDRAWSLVHRD